MTTPDNALIDSMPELDIDTAGHTGMRIRGYSVERVKVLLDRIASLEAEKVQLMKRIHEAADLAEGDAAVIELLERENADLKARLSQAQAVPTINEVWDARLGRVAMRFVDRAGDVHPGIDDAETICKQFHEAMMAEIERVPHVQAMLANAPIATEQAM